MDTSSNLSPLIKAYNMAHVLQIPVLKDEILTGIAFLRNFANSKVPTIANLNEACTFSGMHGAHRGLREMVVLMVVYRVQYPEQALLGILQLVDKEVLGELMVGYSRLSAHGVSAIIAGGLPLAETYHETTGRARAIDSRGTFGPVAVKSTMGAEYPWI